MSEDDRAQKLATLTESKFALPAPFFSTHALFFIVCVFFLSW
jgi:hypothetical protein